MLLKLVVQFVIEKGNNETIVRTSGIKVAYIIVNHVHKTTIDAC